MEEAGVEVEGGGEEVGVAVVFAEGGLSGLVFPGLVFPGTSVAPRQREDANKRNHHIFRSESTAEARSESTRLRSESTGDSE